MADQAKIDVVGAWNQGEGGVRRMGEEVYFEQAIRLPQILRMMGICRAKFYTNHHREMFACGAIYKVRRGRPPREYIMGFPSRIQAYIALRASQGEII